MTTNNKNIDKQGKKLLNVPNLRFPEFEGEWEETTIANVATVVGGGTPETSIKEYWDGDIIWFTPSEIGKKKYVAYSERTISCEGMNNSSAKLLPIGTILLSTRATIGEASIATQSCCTNQGFQSLIANENINNEFLYYLIATKRKDLLRKSCGSTFLEISAKEIRKIKVRYASYEEQSKIARFLALIDERIATQSRIIDKLQSLMKGLNNYLMDNSSWENVRVGDFMDFYSTNSLSWEQLDYKQGKIKNLHYGLIHSGLPTLIDCCLCTLPNIKDEFLLKQHTLCEDGDVAFADASEDTNEVGKAVEFYNCKEQSVVCGLHTIHGRDKANLTIVGFKGFAFNAKYFHDQLRRISQGSKIYSISTENVKSCYLRIPSKSEQRQVARLLSTFLQKINIAEQELKAYQEQKKYLLKAMFV